MGQMVVLFCHNELSFIFHPTGITEFDFYLFYFSRCLIDFFVAHLICPISFDDPGQVWNDIVNDITQKLPLREVTWKHPISGVFINIPKLPLKFLPSSAHLFKETEHPFRWFLAPYVYLYIINADTFDSYKSVKAIVKQWIDGLISNG